MLELLNLNSKQRSVAENLDAHILLTAPAGTGKTDTLAYRIANILDSGRAEPEEVLCLTFTNKACQEMRERIELRAGEPGSRVCVRTFHRASAMMSSSPRPSVIPTSSRTSSSLMNPTAAR